MQENHEFCFNYYRKVLNDKTMMTASIKAKFNKSECQTNINKEQEIKYSTLEEKHEISTMAKDVKVESLNFCNSRISDLMDMDEITSLLDGTNAISGTNGESVIKIKPRLCSSSLNNNNEGYTRQKSVYDLPGFAELSRL